MSQVKGAAVAVVALVVGLVIGLVVGLFIPFGQVAPASATIKTETIPTTLTETLATKETLTETVMVTRSIEGPGHVQLTTTTETMTETESTTALVQTVVTVTEQSSISTPGLVYVHESEGKSHSENFEVSTSKILIRVLITPLAGSRLYTTMVSVWIYPAQPNPLSVHDFVVYGVSEASCEIPINPGKYWIDVKLSSNCQYKIEVYAAGSSQSVSQTTTAQITTGATTTTTAQATYKYVGSVNSNVYHYPWCTYAKRIKPENEIWFIDENDAKSKGYRPCSVCSPPG